MTTLLRVLGGSRAYGLEHAESDWDIKGCFIYDKPLWFSRESLPTVVEHKAQEGHLEQIPGQEVQADLALFEIRHFFDLLEKNNPNILECLFIREDQIYDLHPSFQHLVEERDIFLSKRTQESYVGYAISQIKRAETHRKWLLNPPQKAPQRSDYNLPPIPEFKKDQQNAFLAYLAKMVKANKKYFTILEDTPDLLLQDVICSTPADRLSELGQLFGLDTNFIQLIQKEKQYEQDMANWKSYLNWQNNRNPKRYELEKKAGYDSKNIMHCIRLLHQAYEIISSKGLNVDRTNIDADYLKSIKSGTYTYEEIIETTDQLRTKIKMLLNPLTYRKHPIL